MEDLGDGRSGLPEMGAFAQEAHAGGAERCDASIVLGSLMKTIEGEIIPRLAVAHAAAPCGRRSARPGPGHVAELTRVALTGSADDVLGYVLGLVSAGTPVADVHLRLLAPTARELGRMWESDACGFAEVTLGLCHLHRVLRELAGPDADRGRPATPGRRAMLYPAPGEQHMFGVLMVSEFFRRAGWEVVSGPAPSADGLVREVAGTWFDVIGLSASTEAALDAMPGQLAALREASRNPHPRILVGGLPFTERPDLAGSVGADGTAGDAAAASAGQWLAD